MKKSFVKIAITTTILATLMLGAQAHTSIWPRQSIAGVSERYTVRVPTEGKVMTTGAEMEAPEGVVITSIAAPMGWTYEVRRKDDRIVGISWKMNIKSGEFAEFAFTARNPRDKDQIVWTLRQRFADGTVEDFTKGPNGIRSTAVVKLAPRPN
ncbi:MAG: DUF1775 domain-containing protein [Rhizobiales bacterium]|nr:DUF1775 domain-containing protein [Hyphomicrobiales bacterium]